MLFRTHITVSIELIALTGFFFIFLIISVINICLGRNNIPRSSFYFFIDLCDIISDYTHAEHNYTACEADKGKDRYNAGGAEDHSGLLFALSHRVHDGENAGYKTGEVKTTNLLLFCAEAGFAFLMGDAGDMPWTGHCSV
jgi:hypothetical protein